MKKIMIVGAGACQLNVIKKSKALGYTTIVSDYSLTSPGKKYGDVSVLADTFSVIETLDMAKKHLVDGILTSGTDQPVLTVTKVAHALDKYAYLSDETALSVTNKKIMKALFSQYDIPTVKYSIIDEHFDDSSLSQIKFPVIVKPLDSQGQRGIFKLDTIEAIREHFHAVLEHSRADEIIVEEYYKNKEITVSGWVDAGKCYIFTVTDRVTFNADYHVGVCLAHEYPSIHLEENRDEIVNVTHQICSVFNIENGPIYFQYLMGKEGLRVNEIACRLGGAYEDLTIPYVTGVDVLERLIYEHLEEPVASLDYKYKEDKVFSTQLFFCKPGYVEYMTPIEEIKALPYVLDAAYNYDVGDVIPITTSAAQRAGVVIITGENEKELVNNINAVYDMLIIRETENLVIRGKRYYR